MSRKFIATVLAVSVTITGLSVIPARASEAEDIARILGTAATLYILGNTAQRAEDGRTHTRPVHSRIHDDRYYDRNRDTGRVSGERGHDRDRDRITRDRQRDRVRTPERGIRHWDQYHARTPWGRDGHRDTNRARQPHDGERFRDHRRALPASCLRELRGHHGHPRRVFGKRCLKKRADVRYLPAVCETGFRGRSGKWRQGYRAGCMRHQGFRIAWNR
ncbi:hypothetical protein [Aestuariicoccus sp. MJ-SS9]|uniref:hypothetical protein n=1 Tax=Aestuariicoccus sp. MJ-SS9 TaxID=3079855 RepID=UPI002909CE3E|nr:hypothetical protein [Aestuariicoccus sp. MJ-SS9]MDU8911400.1 hypothetical protein [Aestuariicoccus sp. MJ-SS9]